MKVWDLPTRLFHWGIVLLVGAAWYTAEAGLMEWHFMLGIAALAAVAFRLLWGFVGPKSARFSHFLRSPITVAEYLRTGSGGKPRPGHNPLGGYSVVAMLAALGLQVSSGMLAIDVDGLESGPLSYRLTFEQGRVASSIHQTSFLAIQILVLLHVLAIVYYRIRGRHLVMPMITGRDDQVDTANGECGTVGGVALRAFASLGVASLLAFWVSRGAPL
jgi:cytochrome b